MGDNSWDRASVLYGLSDSDEFMSLLIKDVRAEDLLQERGKILLQPAVLPDQNNIHVIRDVELGPGSSSCQITKNLQNRMMITNGGCLINPLGFPYRSRRHVAPAAASSGSGVHSSQELLIMNDIPVNKRGKNEIQEATTLSKGRKSIRSKTEFQQQNLEPRSGRCCKEENS